MDGIMKQQFLNSNSELAYVIEETNRKLENFLYRGELEEFH